MSLTECVTCKKMIGYWNGEHIIWLKREAPENFRMCYDCIKKLGNLFKGE